MFASAHLGSKKPDQEFFEKVCDQLGVDDKRQILFWDDSLENVEAAREFGIAAELFANKEDFYKTMEAKYL